MEIEERHGRWLPLPSKEVLNSLFSYDEETGLLTRKVTANNNGAKAGSIAGCKNPKGYLVVSIKNKVYRVHRIIWAMKFGEVPTDMEIDHIDGDRSNNKLSNLRLVTHLENLKNSAMRSDNTSGARGVQFNKERNRTPYTAIIYHDKRYRYLGGFKNFEDAVMARKEAEKLLGYSPRHGN